MIVQAHMHNCISSQRAETFSPHSCISWVLVPVIDSVYGICMFCENHYLWSDVVSLYMIFLCSPLCCLFCVVAIRTIHDDRLQLWLTCLTWWISPLDLTTQSRGGGTTIERLTDTRIAALLLSVWCKLIPVLGDGFPWPCRLYWPWIWAEATLLLDPLHLHPLEKKRTWWI